MRIITGTALVALLGGALAQSGCSTASDDCELSACGGSGTGASSTGGGGDGGGGGTGGGTPTECVPELAGGPVADDCGVFVAQGAGGGSGTKADPVASIAAALETGKSRIYLCAETFVEAVALPAGTSIYGGLDCQSDWTWSGSDKSGIEGAAGEIALTVSGSGSSTVADVSVTAADAVDAGGSSIAALVEGSTVDLVRVDLVAGAGMAGDDGEAHAQSAAPDGNGGFDGSWVDSPQTCTDSTAEHVGGLGGDALVCPNGIDSGAGGKGGNGTTSETGDSGLPGGPNDTGGTAGTGQPTPGQCTTGGQGAVGDDAALGEGAAGLGTITAAGWAPPAAPDGEPGQPGKGGGGGGGGHECQANSSFYGPSGGGGGSGGCGGLGGNGGQSGGASIALISLDATVTLSASTLTAADGGAGGGGELGQTGGNGELGGSPGAAGACPGGLGGSGGRGAPGGGGLGGHSLGIAYTGTLPTYEPTDVTISVASTPALGGIGATDGVLGTAGDGDPGLALETQPFD